MRRCALIGPDGICTAREGELLANPRAFVRVRVEFNINATPVFSSSCQTRTGSATNNGGCFPLLPSGVWAERPRWRCTQRSGTVPALAPSPHTPLSAETHRYSETVSRSDTTAETPFSLRAELRVASAGKSLPERSQPCCAHVNTTYRHKYKDTSSFLTGNRCGDIKFICLHPVPLFTPHTMYFNSTLL